MIPWWGWLIISVVAGGFAMLLIVLTIIVVAARAEIKAGKLRAEIARAKMRHPSYPRGDIRNTGMHNRYPPPF